MRCLAVISMFCMLVLGCEEEPKMERSPDPPASPKQVQPAAEATPPEAAPPVEAPAVKTPAPKDTKTKKKVDEPLAPAPRPKTLAPVNGAALGGAKTTRLVQLIQPASQLQPPVEVRITSPAPGDVLRRSTLKVKVSLKNFVPQKSDDGRGRWLKVVLDNEAARDWYDPDDSAFEISGVSPGWHTVRVFAVDEYGECVKDPNAFDAINFYARTDKNAPNPLNFGEPFLTYNLPTGNYQGDAARRIPLDFHLANGQLKKDGHRVRVQVGALPAFDLSAWSPVYLENLPSGEHAITLTLLGTDGKPVSHPWNPLERTFKVEK